MFNNVNVTPATCYGDKDSFFLDTVKEKLMILWETL